MGREKKNNRDWTKVPGWESIPAYMRQEAVRPYYDVLCRHKMELKCKRAFDLILADVLLLLLALPMAVIAMMIRLDSPGPVFYRQERVTAYGRIFRIHKFRTMVDHADQMGSAVTVQGDQRITRVGKLLRNLRLDELPQLLDVIAGDMTFVGTRPEVVKYVRRYRSEMWATLLLPAGITSEASIRFKDEAEILDNAVNADEVYVRQVLPQKMKWNLQSIREFSLCNDIRCMFATAFAVFR